MFRLTTAVPNPIKMGRYPFVSKHDLVSFSITEIMIAPDVGPLVFPPSIVLMIGDTEGVNDNQFLQCLSGEWKKEQILNVFSLHELFNSDQLIPCKGEDVRQQLI